tara:strand:- start:7314 stop:8432 length:1119 start_codon:yes stop_codon:yes gene_type:complete
MKVLICGVGRMGTAIAYAMQKLGADHIIGMDTNANATTNMPTPKGKETIDFFVVDDANDICKGIEALSKPDVVISSLPYHQTEKVGLWCVENGVRYCDLGGRVDVSQSIKSSALWKATAPVFTDLGLAPGWVNILAEQGYRELHKNGQITKVEMMVGGLPDYLLSNNNPLRYGITWSVDGLINEYRDDCLVLKSGEIVTVKGMDGLEDVDTESLGKLEAFYTSGGASHSIDSMKERGVDDCHYKTLRYKGHCDFVKFLIRDCDLDDETLNKIFVSGCGYANKDEVIIVAKVYKDNRLWKEEKLIKSDDRFSAMQKATAFPISSVASLMAEGKMEGKRHQHRDYWTNFPKVLTYADVPHEEFNERLHLLLDTK